MKFRIAVLGVLLFMLAGCADCFSMKYFRTNVTNNDSAQQTFELCRKDAKATLKSVFIPAGAVSSIDWESKKIFNRTSLTTGCHDRHDEYENVEVLLTTTTQASFRLCLDSDDSYAVVPAGTPCGSGQQEVTENCSTP